MKFIITTIFVFYFFIFSNAQAPDIQWQKCLGGSGSEEAVAIKNTYDNGFIIAANTNSNDGNVIGNHGNYDAWIVKVDSIGNIIWSKCYGGSNDDKVTSIEQTKDSGYIFVGYTNSNDGDVTMNYGDRDAWIVRLDKNGNILWQKVFGGSGSDAFSSINQIDSNQLILAGSTNSLDGVLTGLTIPCRLYYTCSNYKWIVKLDDTAKILLQNLNRECDEYRSSSWGCTNRGGVIKIIKILNGNYLFSTEMSRQDLGGIQYHTSLFSVNNKLQTLWTKDYYTYIHYQYANLYGNSSFIQTKDSNIYFFPIANKKYLVKLDQNGVTKFDSSYNINSPLNNYEEVNNNLSEISYTTNGLILIGYDKNNKVNVTRVDSLGRQIWNKPFGGSSRDRGIDIFSSKDSGFVCLGNTSSNDGDVSGNHGNGDIWLVKLFPEKPTIKILASDTMLCSGSNISFTSKIFLGGSNTHYQWQVNGVNVGSDIDTFSSTTLQDKDTITCWYSSIVNGKLVKVLSNTIILKAPAPTITIKIICDSICQGSIVWFSTQTYRAGAKPHYQWKVNGINVGTDTSFFETIALNNNDKVSCVLTSNWVCTNPVSSNEITLKVFNYYTPQVIIKPSTKQFCNGYNNVIYSGISTLDCSFTRQPIINSAIWFVNNVQIQSTNGGLIYNNFKNNDSVYCKMKTDYFCPHQEYTYSNKIIVKVNDSTAFLNLMATNNPVCNGDSLRFVAKLAGGYTDSWIRYSLNKKNWSAPISTNNTGLFATKLFASNDIFFVYADYYDCSGNQKGIKSDEIYITATDTLKYYAIINSDKLTICKDDTGNFRITTSCPKNLLKVYKWYVNAAYVSNGEVFKTSNLNNNDSVLCKLFFTNCNGSIDSAISNSLKVTVMDKETATITITASNTVVLQGNNINFNSSVVNGGVNPYYDWMVNNSSIGNGASSFSTNNLNNKDSVFCILKTSTEKCVVNNKIESNKIVVSVNPINANKIYPNPAKSELNIQSDIKNVTVYNYVGKIVLSKQFDLNQLVNKINVSSLKRGLYIAKLTDRNNNTTTQKFIVE